MKKLIALVLVAVPTLVSAQTLETIKNINDVAAKATNIGNLVVALAISLCVVWIIVSIVRYFIAGGDDAAKNAKSSIIFGVVGLFIIMSIWGLVNILRNTFNTNNVVPERDINIINTLPKPVQVQ
jgi:bacteriorhodopsin